jgi:8-oxo-dGTP pyrophosphatase MutT (NUDIX family)
MVKGKIYLQYAALPFRMVDGVLIVMLVTSRETKRWIVPKGWPVKVMEPYRVAEREAFEEAGLRGRIADTVLATFEYAKQVDAKHTISCLVEVFPLEVREELPHWPEENERQRAWMTPADAAATVVEPGLSKLFLALAADPTPLTGADRANLLR